VAVTVCGGYSIFASVVVPWPRGHPAQVGSVAPDGASANVPLIGPPAEAIVNPLPAGSGEHALPASPPPICCTSRLPASATPPVASRTPKLPEPGAWRRVLMVLRPSKLTGPSTVSACLVRSRRDATLVSGPTAAEPSRNSCALPSPTGWPSFAFSIVLVVDAPNWS
jgi:hypothetical protein